jgi:hypothetical protein
MSDDDIDLEKVRSWFTKPLRLPANAKVLTGSFRVPINGVDNMPKLHMPDEARDYERINMSGTRQLANFIVLAVGYEQWVRMNYIRLRRKGFTPPERRKIDFLREMAARSGAPFRWTVQTQMAIYPYLVERLTPERLALPAGYDLGDQPRWSSAPEK